MGLFIVLNSGISSALPSNAVPAIMQDFHESGDQQKVLPTAVFLIGYVVGPLLFSPLSETIGRKPVLIWSFTVFVLATLGCALAPNWSSLLVFRTICGFMGAAPQTVVGGIYADLFFDLRSRGRAMAMYMSVCCNHLLLRVECLNSTDICILGLQFWSYSRPDYLWMLGQVWLEMDF